MTGKLPLGSEYFKSHTTFSVWSPEAETVHLRIYQDGHTDSLLGTYQMKRQAKGIWSIQLIGDWHGKFYTYQITFYGKLLNETSDPYAKAVGVNGYRAMVVDLNATNPPGWEFDTRPTLISQNDAIIYELHVRDFSISKDSGIIAKGKFEGFTEKDTVFQEVFTGLSHLKELGVTHVQLQPCFDFKSIDESDLNSATYNWGYDPQNYHVPEGSYASNPYDGTIRIREFKQMVKTLHANGIRVIMDVVYNHTGDTETSHFNQIFPGYYYRYNKDGSFSNASGCGNETASEKEMMRSFIIHSVQYWIEEYHVDGFRFDLMGIHDLVTMNRIVEEVQKIDPSILLYGEGWTASDSPLPPSQRATKINLPKMPGIGVFSDELRDGIRGDLHQRGSTGFVSGKTALRESVKFGIVAAINHPQVDYKKVNHANLPRATSPQQTVNYTACHDDLTLWDHLSSTTQGSEVELINMHLLADTLVLTSQGIPFLLGGSDFLRTKYGDSNSYCSGDQINQIDWRRKKKYYHVFTYYRKLIDIRKSHPIFRLVNNAEIQKRLVFLTTIDGVIAYQIDGKALAKESWKCALLVFNALNKEINFELPMGKWMICLYDKVFRKNEWAESCINVPPKTALILYKHHGGQ